MIIVFFRSWKRLTGPWNFVTVKYQLCTPVTVTIFDGYLMDIIQILYFVNFPRDFCPPTSTNFRSSFSEFLAPRCVKLHGSFGTSQLLCCRAPQCASWKVAPMAFGLDDFHEILWFSLIFWFWDSITIDSIIYIYINNQLYIYISYIIDFSVSFDVHVILRAQLWRSRRSWPKSQQPSGFRTSTNVWMTQENVGYEIMSQKKRWQTDDISSCDMNLCTYICI
jgi:hypothetical protein